MKINEATEQKKWSVMAMREKLIRCLKYCASTSDSGNDCTTCERWEYDCGSGHCVDDLLEQAAEALEQFRWIPVTERLPEKDGIYLTFSKKKEYEFHFFQTGKRMWSAVWDEDGVTHWMPLPEPPKEVTT